MEVRKTIRIGAAAEAVFAALTRPAQITACFPLEAAAVDARPGGEIRLDGMAGGEPFTDYGVIECFDPPRAFAYRYWSTNHGTPRTDAHHRRIEYLIETALDGMVTLEVRHAGLPSAEDLAQMDAAWDSLLRGLAAWIENGAEGTPR